MAIPPTATTTAATAATWYAGFGGFTAVRRAQIHTRTGLPVHGRPGQTIVALHGELDIASAPALRTDLLSTLQHSARMMVLDLGEVTFCDAAGLAVLLDVRHRATGLGVTLRLANPRPQIAMLLCLTGMDPELTLPHPVVQLARHDALAQSPVRL